MTLEEEFRLLVSGYYGVSEIDEYTSKVYVLKDIEDYIRSFIQLYPIPIDYYKIADELEKLPALLILPKVKGSMELTLLIRARLNEMKK